MITQRRVDEVALEALKKCRREGRAARGNREEMIDAYGDVLVTLIIGAALADVDLTKCLESAYSQRYRATGGAERRRASR